MRIAAATSGAAGVVLIGMSVNSGASPARSANQTLDVSISGSGHVSSSPSGIDCPSTCSASYKDFSDVSLSAKPASGWTFTGWSGDCKGTGGCSVKMDTKHAVGASFTANAPPPPATTTTATTTAATTTEAAPPAKPGPPVLTDFDDVPNGSTPDAYGIAFGGGVKIVTPAHVAPSSFPRALAAPGPATQSCGAASTLHMSFTAPLTALSLASGVDDQPAPGDGTWARLLAFDGAGHAVATSGDVLVARPGQLGGIVTPLAVASVAGDIASATLTVGCGTASHDTGPRIAMADNVQITPNAENLIQPSITIDAPADGALVDGVPTVSGTVFAPSGVESFCVTTANWSSLPVPCNQQVAFAGHSPLSASGAYSIGIPLDHRDDRIYAWVRDRRGNVATTSIRVTYPSPGAYYTLTMQAMEVTQAVQEWDLPQFNRTLASAPGLARTFAVGGYVGVRLAEGKRTIVRAYATASPVIVDGVTAQLYGYRQSGSTLTPLPGSPIASDNGAVTVRGATLAAQRRVPNGGFAFTLPPAWTTGTVTLVTQLVPPPRTSTRIEANAYGDVSGLQNVLFEHQHDYTITPVAEFTTSPSRTPPWPPQNFFSDFQTVLPTGDGQVHVHAYGAYIDVTGGWNVFDIFNHDMHLVDALCGYSPRPGDGQIVGVFGSGITNDALTAPAPGCLFRGNMAIVDPGRRQTTVAHELGHLMGRPHASGSCGGGFPQPNEGWPTDERGYLNGVGIDPRAGSGGGAGPYKLFFPGADNGYGGTIYYDYMSYCSGQTNPGSNCYEDCSWISPRGWTELFDWLHTHTQSLGFRAQRQRAAAPSGYSVTAGVDGAGKGDILTVRPATGPPTASVPDATYSLVVRDAAGAVLETLGLSAEPLHVDSPKPQAPALFGVVVPAAAHALELKQGTTVLGTRMRTPHAPVVSFVTPRRGQKVSGAGTVSVRWKATDADRGPLLATLDYSTNGGKSWHTVAAGLGKTRYALPARLLEGSRAARLRLLVSDGWNTTTALSAPFVAAGHGPLVLIFSPRTGFRIGAKGSLFLSGTATTDSGAPLTGARLSWYAGRKLLGHGAQLSVRVPAKGRLAIRLVARDAHGRTSTARTTVSVR